jgi:uncharacterized protein YjbI with pentapeptide repeats
LILFQLQFLPYHSFTGASLKRAKFTGADLREAKFECAWIGGNSASPGYFPVGLKDENFGCAQLRGADFRLARLQGASLQGAQLQDTMLLDAQLQGANLDFAQLPGASFMTAQLQGASLRGTQLAGAFLAHARLKGAFLSRAQLQGADLQGAQLQGALLNEAQLQAGSLFDARLEGASLRQIFVWRTDPPPNTNGAFVDAPELGPKYFGLDCPVDQPCDWSKTSYAELKSLIENSVSLPVHAILSYEGSRHWKTRPMSPTRPRRQSGGTLQKEWARSVDSYPITLAKIFKEIGCAVEGAPYVIRGLIRQVYEHQVHLDYRFERYPLEAVKVAAAFLDEPNCPGARGLSEESKAKLQEIRDRGLPASPGPGAAAR